MPNAKEPKEITAEGRAPFSTTSGLSRGRRHPEPEHPFRSAFQRDRDRIIHSHAFRRLEYKTQVFVYHEGDHYRTRLTHTIEVAQISRTIARALGINEDLAEAIALAHDLGHPPFGHTGEKALNELMAGSGGFEHNAHTLRIVEELEMRYPTFRGLNLTWEVREGIVKHGTEYDSPETFGEYLPELAASLEAQIVDMADEIAYNNHDIDDGLSSKMLDYESLKGVRLWRETSDVIRRRYPSADPKILKCQTIISIINQQVTDLIETTLDIIRSGHIGTVDDVRAAGRSIARFSPEMEHRNRELKEFLKDHLYDHYRVLRMRDKAERILSDLFSVYSNEPRILPPHYYSEIGRVGRERLICDYVAGMTDRYALEEHKKLFDPHAKV